MPTPDASWAPAAIAGFVQRAALLDEARLAIFAVVTAAALALFVLAIASTVVLKRG